MDHQNPTIILVEPQLGMNIGSVARAMLNFGLTQLRLVRPRDGWPNPEATAPAAGADRILAEAQVFLTTQEAIGDLHHVFATSARLHDMVKSIYSPHQGIKCLKAYEQSGAKVGILFGSERAGLCSDDVALCEATLRISTNPDFSSMNLAHAVALIAYEWSSQSCEDTPHIFRMGDTILATQKEVNGFFEHFIEILETSGFLRHQKKRRIMIRNLHNLIRRIHFTQQDVKTLRGVLTSLSAMKSKDKKPDA